MLHSSLDDLFFTECNGFANIYYKIQNTFNIFTYVVKTEEAKSWLSLKSATWILWSLGGGIIDLQGMEEVATEQEGQGISRHALCTDSHLAALWKTDCTCLHIMLHILLLTLSNTLLHTHTLHICGSAWSLAAPCCSYEGSLG